ncbi:MAG: hypothetical protein HWD92_07880 [Flavobacteriia bacterium]|nr:hypothetical protein [Flavobacteriia bacterium]
MKSPWNAIKQKVDSGASPMQDGDWAAMEAMLDGQKSGFKWGKFGKYGLSLLVGVALGVGALAIYENATLKAEYTPLPDVSNTETPASESTNGMSTSTTSELSSSNSSQISESVSDLVTTTESTTASASSNNAEEVASINNTREPQNNSGDDATASAERFAQSPSNESFPSLENELGMNPMHSTSLADEGQNTQNEKPSMPAVESSMESANQQDEQSEGTSPMNDASQGETTADETESSQEMNMDESTSDDRAGEADEETTAEDLDDEEEATSESASPVIRSSDHRNTQFGVEANYSWGRALGSGLQSHDIGLDAVYRWRNWNFQTGIHYVNTQGTANLSVSSSQIVFDTTYTQNVVTRSDTNYIRTWVITGRNTGMFVTDTSVSNVTDTVIITSVDSSIQNVQQLKPTDVSVNYFSVPLLAGYEWKWDEWSYGVQGGINFRSISYGNIEVLNPTSYGLDALIRPYIGYSFAPKWNAYLRPMLSIPITSDPIFNRQNFINAGIQIGVRYEF